MMSLEGAGNSSNLGAAESDILNPGQAFDAYKVMRCLYFSPLGGFYLLNNVQSGVLYAAYIFPGAVDQDPNFPTRFHDYSTRIAALSHSSILKAKNPDIIANRYCLFYEPIEGNSVEAALEELAIEKRDAERIAKQTKQPFKPGQQPDDGPVVVAGAGFSPDRVRHISDQVCQALKHAHEQGLHHFGLSCHSLILGLQDSVQVWGIGIYEMLGDELFQRLISQGVPPLKSNQRKRVVNPVEHLPPEVRRGSAHDARSDIYSIGFCSYQMLTGLKVGPNFQLPTQVVSTIPPAWDSLVTKCLDPDNSNRYQTVAHLTAQLDSMAPPSQKAKDASAKAPPKGAVAKFNKGLDIIPLPGKIQEKAKPTQKLAFRLAILGVLGAIVVGTGAMLYPKLVSDEIGASEGPKVTRTPPGSTPRLKLDINVSKARAVFTGKATGNLFTTDGRIEASMPLGEYAVSVEATNYAPARISVLVGNTPIVMPVRLEPNYGLLQVKAMPGSRLYSVGSNGARRFVGIVGTTGEENFSTRLFARKYDFEISAPGYAPSVFPGVALNTVQSTVLTADLVALPGTVRILTEPAGAQILVQIGETEPEERGATPLELTDVPVQTPIVFTAVHPLYKTRSLAFSLRPGQKEVLDFGVMQRKVGKLIPQITFGGVKPTEQDLRKLSFKVEDTLFTVKDGVMENVPAGPVRIQLEHPDYLPWQANANMPEDQTLTFSANLEPKPAQITVTVPAAVAYEFFADGVPLKGDDDTYEVPAGANRQLEVRIKDHLSVRTTLNLAPNEKRKLPVTLQRIPAPEQGRNYTVAYADINLIWAPAGTYQMGTPLVEQGRLPNEGNSNNRQVETSFTRGFWIGQYEITQTQYAYLMGTNPSEFKNRPVEAGQVRPVERVSWQDAVAYAKKLTEMERLAGRLPSGYVYRLPTQAEWEYACRAGTNTPFHWGSEADPQNGNFKGVYPRTTGSTIIDDSYTGTAPIGSYRPNSWGIYDMHGNVKEWCLDAYTERFPQGPLVDWPGEPDGQYFPVRGGGWDDLAIRVRAGARERMAPNARTGSTGFRLVLAQDLETR